MPALRVWRLTPSARARGARLSGIKLHAQMDMEDRIYLAGEHLSYLTGWQEGAVLSAQHVLGALHEEVHQRAQS